MVGWRDRRGTPEGMRTVTQVGEGGGGEGGTRTGGGVNGSLMCSLPERVYVTPGTHGGQGPGGGQVAGGWVGGRAERTGRGRRLGGRWGAGRGGWGRRSQGLWGGIRQGEGWGGGGGGRIVRVGGRSWSPRAPPAVGGGLPCARTCDWSRRGQFVGGDDWTGRERRGGVWRGGNHRGGDLPLADGWVRGPAGGNGVLRSARGWRVGGLRGGGGCRVLGWPPCAEEWWVVGGVSKGGSGGVVGCRVGARAWGRGGRGEGGWGGLVWVLWGRWGGGWGGGEKKLLWFGVGRFGVGGVFVVGGAWVFAVAPRNLRDAIGIDVMITRSHKGIV